MGRDLVIEPTEDMVVAAIEALRDTVLDDEVTAARAIAEAVLAIVERDQVAPLRALIGEFIDPDPCSYDHHGYCQAHGLDPAPCPHQRAKELP